MTSQECDCQSLRKRVDALETQNRRYMKVGIVVLILAACAVFMAQTPPRRAAPKRAASKRVIEADDFVLHDSDGHVRARLGMWQGQQPSLVLFDSTGSPSVMISGGDQPEITIADSASRTKRGSMWLGPSGPNFGLFDGEGKSRASLYLRDSLDEERLTFVDAKARPRAGIGLVKSEPSVLIADASGNIVWSAPIPTGAGTPRSETRPRVVIESWESEEGAGIFAARPPKQNAQALDEMPVFIQRCPQSAAVLEKHEGDYVLRFDHHYSQGSYSYGYTLFDGSGGSLGTGSGLALWAAVDAACKGILTDSGSKAR
jgi:hypothetical protein